MAHINTNTNTNTKLNSNSIQIRQATPKDASYIADICAQAMLDDEWYQYYCPERERYYLSFRDGFLRYCKFRMLQPSWVILVAVVSTDATTIETNTTAAVADLGRKDRFQANQQGSEDQGSAETKGEHGDEVIVGCCMLERRGNDAHARMRRITKRGRGGYYWTLLEAILLSLNEVYIKAFSLDKSINWARYAPFLAALNAWTPFSDRQVPVKDYWHIAFMAVDPPYQRRGIGQKLVRWAILQARSEQVPVSLAASNKGIGLYRKAGFRTVIETPVVDGLRMVGMEYVPLSVLSSWDKRKVA